VTTVLGPAGRSGEADGTAADAAARLRAELPAPRLSWFARNPDWPIVVTLAGWPVWWALGIGNHMFFIMAIPMVRKLYRRRARGGPPVRLPRGFGIWLLFLLVLLAGIVTISLQAPGTIQSSVFDRTLAYTARALDFGGATVFLLYAGNLTEAELPRRRLAFYLGLVGAYTVFGGLFGVVDPHFGFTSPIAKFLPSTLQSALSTSLNPGASQDTALLGTGRVKIPFSYTNMWGNVLAIMLPWLVVAWVNYGTRLKGRLAIAIVAISIIPIVFSLDRGLWVGIIITILYFAIRYALQGKLALLGMFLGALATAAFIVVASPLGSLIQQRLDTPKSNDIRTSATTLSIKDGLSSPIIGYGDSRRAQGGTQSITTGRNANCKKCGNVEVGGDGQMELLLVTTGVLGTALYAAFFAYSMWRYRRDRTAYGMVGMLVLLLGFVFMPVYEATGPPLGFTMLSLAILWKNDRELHKNDQLEPAEPVPAGPALGGHNGRAAITRGLAT
jgi:hypothetical protein